MLRLTRAKLATPSDTPASGNLLEIQQDDVRTELPGQSKTLCNRVRRSDDVDVGLALEHGRHAFADDGMIFDDEDANHSFEFTISKISNS